MRRITFLLSTIIFAVLVSPAAALAQESGTGAIHATEKTITYFGLGLVVGFSVFVWAMSRLQRMLENRKHRKTVATRNAGKSAAWRGGW